MNRISLSSDFLEFLFPRFKTKRSATMETNASARKAKVHPHDTLKSGAYSLSQKLLAYKDARFVKEFAMPSAAALLTRGLGIVEDSYVYVVEYTPNVPATTRKVKAYRVQGL
jgi:hypothetical protein